MKHLLILFFTTLSFLVTAQQTAVKKNPANQVEPFHINVDMKKGLDVIEHYQNLVLIDVRTPEEIAQGKIKNALEMDIKAPDFKDRLAKLDKYTPYMVYCHAGGRSANAMKIMKEMGFKQVFNLDPGYRAYPQDK